LLLSLIYSRKAVNLFTFKFGFRYRLKALKENRYSEKVHLKIPLTVHTPSLIVSPLKSSKLLLTAGFA
jgi:hypothetical protein